MFRDPVLLLAFGLGTGLSPKAPGTVGTLLAFPLALATATFALEVRLGVAILLILAGIWLCGEAARRLGVHDHGGIVWDEIAAMYLVLLFVPLTVLSWILAFVLFRFFDIVKPWPIRDIDHRTPGGAGIMLDDVIAALYTVLILVAAGWLMN